MSKRLRTERFEVAFNAKESAALQMLAKKKGLSRADVVRQLIRDAVVVGKR